MSRFRNAPLTAALALCAFPVFVPAGEAPAPGAPPQQDAQQQLADAQRRLNEAAREVAELSSSMGRRFTMQFGGETGVGGPPPRALLGLSIGSDSGKDGAQVLDVSPGGPAAEAGIKAGDIITTIAGVELTKDSNPGRALVEKVRELEPDQKVKIAVLRDGRTQSFEVMPRRAPLDVLVQRNVRIGGPEGPGGRVRAFGPTEPGRQVAELQGAIRDMVERADFRRVEESASRFGGVEFASISERLGSYFGVKSGVLVVRAGVNSPFKLQDGDVILSIDGREASNAQQAGRILRSYQPGEKLTLKVQRDRKALSIDATAPGGRDRD
jgi:S1-C subfamily serine protease